jgi:predicted AlkP superfamily phosphohydrolase/phosphomutase
VLKAYKQMDEIVGEARRLAGPEALLMVLSDHGFSSFRRGVNYNTWLVRNGLMRLRGQSESADLEKLFDTRDLFPNVDWSRTKAYALGLGSIYVNLAGREREGNVAPGPEYEAVVRTIRDGLESLVDPETGERPVSRVWRRDEIYAPGFDARLIPDLRAGNALNYRVSWQTTLGGIPPETVEDNRKAWSGDHCSTDPDLIPGVLFSSRPMMTTSPAMADVMPSILARLGLPRPKGLHGRSFYEESR